MFHIELTPGKCSHKVCILLKTAALTEKAIRTYYMDPLDTYGVKETDVYAMDLEYNQSNKAPAALMKNYIVGLLAAVDSLKTNILYTCDSNYFKQLTGLKKTTSALGYVFPCAIKGYEHIQVVMGYNHQALFHNPAVEDEIRLGLKTVAHHILGINNTIGDDVIRHEEYPEDLLSIGAFLERLHEHSAVTCDIEAYSLQHWLADIGTIGFAWDMHSGGAFCVKHGNTDTEVTEIKQLLKEFFDTYQGKIIYHNASYDLKPLCFELYMNGEHENQSGLLEGVEALTRNIGDSKIITYLATNSTTGNKLGLKSNAHEFTGDYAEDVKDINLVPTDDLLRYNLIDCMATWYVTNKYYQTLVDDKQLQVYNDIMLPSVKLLLQIELQGMPMHPDTLYRTADDLQKEEDDALQAIKDSHAYQKFTKVLQAREMVKANLKLKTKQHPIEHFESYVFNPNSNVHLQILLYDYLDLDVLDTTDSKQPATGKAAIKKLMVHNELDDETSVLLKAILAYGAVSKINTTFIPAFKKGVIKSDGMIYLHGNFNLGGTVSGRLSSSKPNLQNLPSGSKYGKAIKNIFRGPEGWLYGGADFASLEDRISALLTKDTQKLKVYTDGYDGHSLRAYGYFGEQMPDIDPNSVESINSIADKYPHLRQDSKAPTFLLTYGGTWMGIVNLGFTPTVAKQIERNYHRLYEESDNWIADKISKAAVDGFVTCAFGLRVRTPILKRTILNTRVTPFAAQAESRTAGNALGQSWGLLNNRAAIEFQNRLLKSEYALDVKIVCLIHDAIYLVWRDDIEVTKWVNDHLGDCMLWQEDPEIVHEDVSLSGELDIFYPSWAYPCNLPNLIPGDEIVNRAEAHMEKLNV